MVHDGKSLKGRANDAIAAACLYIACRSSPLPLPLPIRPNLGICFTQMGNMSPSFSWPSLSIWPWLSTQSSLQSWSYSGQTWTSVSLKWETFRLRPPLATRLCHAGDEDDILRFMIFKILWILIIYHDYLRWASHQMDLSKACQEMSIATRMRIPWVGGKFQTQAHHLVVMMENSIPRPSLAVIQIFLSWKHW